MPGFADLPARKRSGRVGERDPTVIDKFLEFGRGLAVLAISQESFSAHECRVYGAVEPILDQSACGELIRLGGLEFLYRLFRVAVVERGKGAKHRHVLGLNPCILRELPLEVVCPLL